MTYHATQIIGHTGRAAEMRYTPNGTAVTDFSVAVNEQYTDSTGEKVKKTIWYKVTAWGKLAEICNSIMKGDRVFINGRLAADPETGGPRTWIDKEGVTRSQFELTASEVRFLTSRDKTETPTEEAF